jgi:SnoaL-like protein
MLDTATAILQAFAKSDLETIRRLCADDLLLVGTDRDEFWDGLPAVMSSFGGAYDLDVEWVDQPTIRGDWLFAGAVFTEADGSKLPVRVTMIFADGKLTHAHYSVAR